MSTERGIIVDRDIDLIGREMGIPKAISYHPITSGRKKDGGYGILPLVNV
jgi:hypothetical protein